MKKRKRIKAKSYTWAATSVPCKYTKFSVKIEDKRL